MQHIACKCKDPLAPKLAITPILRKPVGRGKTTRNFGDFGKIAKILTCLIENRGVGVTTTLGTSEFIYPNGCFKHTNHHPGREFPCGVGISVSHVFRVILHIDLAIPYHSGWGLEGVEGAQTCGAEIIPTYPTNILHIVSGILVARKIFVC